MAAVNVRHEALDAVHGVQRNGGLLLQGGEGPLQVVFLQILHDQADHAGEKMKKDVSDQVGCIFNGCNQKTAPPPSRELTTGS